MYLLHKYCFHVLSLYNERGFISFELLLNILIDYFLLISIQSLFYCRVEKKNISYTVCPLQQKIITYNNFYIKKKMVFIGKRLE